MDAVTEDKLADDAVTGGKLADYSPITSDNSPGITANKIADNAITAAKINPGAVTGGKLADYSAITSYNSPGITTNKIAAGAVTAPKLQKATKVLGPTELTSQKDDDGAVQGTYQDGRNPDSTPKYVFGNIKPHSIDRFELKNDCVTTEKIANGAVTGGKLADYSAITSDNSPGITTDKIADNAITAAKIAMML